ncbi:hypothetical protein Rhopal_000087-T1 [Rhodotorula paludigena]|uniref:Integral membrane protein n=1 Tax=Rhodotorula paludigena TaxID=86838 RepID=A0AAV5GDH8_9BASI|nr:hypothetical protein Rhopal_000087-T1 [Rhodotorula paludigena]
MATPAQRSLGHNEQSFDAEIEHARPPASTVRRSLDGQDAHERTALLGSSTSRDYRTEAEHDREVLHDAGHPEREAKRPWSLRIDLAVTVVLLVANGYFWTMGLASINSPFVAHTAVPRHQGSVGIPVWTAFLSATLLSFLFPHESPLLSFYTALATAFFALLTLILSLSVTQLRVVEGPLTFIVLALAIVTALHSAFSAALRDRYAPLLDPPEELDPDYEPDTGFWASFKRVMRGCLGFLGISLPLAAAHVAVLVAIILIAIGVIIRSVDASVEQPGQRWKVDPWLWQRRYFPELAHGVFQARGREYRVHLSCRGLGLDDPPFAPVTAAPVNATEAASGRPTVRRTLLVESERGLPAGVDAEWLLRMMRDGELNSGDVETRVCWWDRPGYGFSDASPSSSAPHVVSALTQALSVSGEMARLQPPPTAATAPSPLARSGFILVSRGEATPITTLFAALHPRLVHSFLYLSPVSPSTYYAPSARSRFRAVPHFFSRLLPALYTDLGVPRFWWALRGVSRRRRVLARAGERINGLIERAALQEAYERERGKAGDGAKAWDRRRGRYPVRPTVVLGTAAKGDGSDRFVHEIVGEGLREWDREWKGGARGCDAGGDEEEKCRSAVRDLMALD